MRKERSCGIVAYRNGPDGAREYLLLHYPSGHWDFPKGHVERDETEHETARRELREETGVTRVRLDEGFRHIIRYQFHAGDGADVDKQVVFFCGLVDADRLTISHEHRGYDWLPFGPARDRVTFDNAKRLLEAVERFLSSAGAAQPSSTEADAS